MQDPNSLNTKIAAVALACHLESNDNLTQEIATSALAMYLNSHSGNNTANIVAQVALAIFLENNPGVSFSMPKFANVVSNNSSWGSKILLMRQLPVRR